MCGRVNDPAIQRDASAATLGCQLAPAAPKGATCTRSQAPQPLMVQSPVVGGVPYVRSFAPGCHTTTDPAHMPDSHRRHAEWTPRRVIACAEKTGPCWPLDPTGKDHLRLVKTGAGFSSSSRGWCSLPTPSRPVIPRHRDWPPGLNLARARSLRCANSRAMRACEHLD